MPMRRVIPLIESIPPMKNVKLSAARRALITATLTALTLGGVASAPAAAQSDAGQGAWSVGAEQSFGNWSVRRIEPACILVDTSKDFGSTIALGAMMAPGNMRVNSVVIADPRLNPFVTTGMVDDLALSFDGKAQSVFAAMVNKMPNPNGEKSPMALAIVEPSVTDIFTGTPVEVTMATKGLTLNHKVDASAEALAAWRTCATEL